MNVAQEGSSTGEARKGLTFSTPPTHPRESWEVWTKAFPANRAARSLQLWGKQERQPALHSHARDTRATRTDVDAAVDARPFLRRPRAASAAPAGRRLIHTPGAPGAPPAAQDRRGAPLSLHANLNTGRPLRGAPLSLHANLNTGNSSMRAAHLDAAARANS